jgi:hypothetical protein
MVADVFKDEDLNAVTPPLGPNIYVRLRWSSEWEVIHETSHKLSAFDDNWAEQFPDSLGSVDAWAAHPRGCRGSQLPRKIAPARAEGSRQPSQIAC